MKRRRNRRTFYRGVQSVTRTSDSAPSAKQLLEEEIQRFGKQYRYEDLVHVLASPPYKPSHSWTDDEIDQFFRLPATLGAPADVRKEVDTGFVAAIDHAMGASSFRSDLLSHSVELGQMPTTTFMGYGALQSIAQNGMIRACVQTVTDDMTKKWIEITGGEESDAERVAKLDDLQRNKYHLQSLFHKAIELVGYYGGAFIFIDTGASDDELTLPLALKSGCAETVTDDESGRVASVRFVVIDPLNVTPAEYNSDNPLLPDYMKPSSWYVQGKRVHASRLCVLFDNEPPLLLKPSYNFLGIPRAQILWDYVIHWNESRIYTNDLLKKISLLVVKTSTDEIFSTPDGVRMFDIKMRALQRYRDNNSIYVCDKEREDVANVQTSVAGATDIVRQSLEMIAAINRTPAVKLLGISPSGFNATGESDITNYYDHIRSQQELYREAIMKCLKAIQLVHFDNTIDPTVNFEFVELAGENESAKAMNANTKMQMLSTAVQSNFISADEARDVIKNDADMGMEFLTGDAPQGEDVDYGDGMEPLGDGGDDFQAMLKKGLGDVVSPDEQGAQGTQSQAPLPLQPPLDDASKYTHSDDGSVSEVKEDAKD